MYGTHSRGYFCPVRDTALPGITTNELFLPWMLLSTEISLSRLLCVDFENDVHILSRKTQVYRLMNKKVSDAKTRWLDSTIVGLAVAGIAECRVGGIREGRKHLAASLQLLETRGGIHTVQRVPLWSSIILLGALVSTGLASATFKNINSLNLASRIFKTTLQKWQIWRRNQRSTLQDMSHVDQYNRSVARAFGPLSPLRPFIEPLFHDQTPGQSRCHVAILYIITRTLWDLRNDPKEAISFLDGLLAAIVTGQLPSTDATLDEVVATGKRRPTMKAITVVYILADAVAKLKPTNASTYVGGILQSWDAIQFVELMQLLSFESRLRITTCLSSWLLEKGWGQDPAAPFLTIPERDMENLCEEMILNWLMSQEES